MPVTAAHPDAVAVPMQPPKRPGRRYGRAAGWARQPRRLTAGGRGEGGDQERKGRLAWQPLQSHPCLASQAIAWGGRLAWRPLHGDCRLAGRATATRLQLRGPDYPHGGNERTARHGRPPPRHLHGRPAAQAAEGSWHAVTPGGPGRRNIALWGGDKRRGEGSIAWPGDRYARSPTGIAPRMSSRSNP